MIHYRKGVRLKMSKYEKRMHSVAKLEVAGEVSEGKKVLEGYAAVFNQQADVEGVFDEIILPGAFTKTLSEKHDVLALVNHNFDHVLGRTSNGMLQLSEDSNGLKFTLTLPDTDRASQVYQDVQCGNLKDCSFLFKTVIDEWDYSGQKPLCILKEVELIEVSIVSIPVYEGTEVSARSQKLASEGAFKHAATIAKQKKLVAKINATLEAK